MNPSSPLPDKTPVLGIGISRTTYEECVELVMNAARQSRPLIVSPLAVHGLMTGVQNPDFATQLNRFDILTPDGQPVRWALNAFGSPALKERVYGPTLMLKICEQAAREGIGIYLFGSTKAVLRALIANLTVRFPGLVISGWQADRFRDATAEEDAADVERIRASGARIVFVGRGCPRQEIWCHDHRALLNMPLIAVGAAFDFHAGTLRQAPLWMQKAGLEWLFRLLMEPRRLWKRYVILNPLFALAIARQWVREQRGPNDPPPGRRGSWLFRIAPFILIILVYGSTGNTHDPGTYGRSVASWLAHQWSEANSTSSHGWLIPLVSLWLVWHRRRALASVPRQPDSRALPFLILSLGLLWAGMRTEQPRLGVLSLMGSLVSVPAYLHGWPLARLFLFPVGYLAFMLPMGFLLSYTFPLRLFAAGAATFLLHGLGVHVVQRGTSLLDIGPERIALDVGDPCSGLQSIIAMIALTVVYAYLSQSRTSRRVLLVLCAAPVAVAANIVRILSIALVAHGAGAGRWLSAAHDASGYIVFLSGLVLIMLCDTLISRLRLPSRP